MATEPRNSTACSLPRAAGSRPASAAHAAVVRVGLFAGMAEAAGRRGLDVAWQGGTVADLRAAVAAACPAVAPLLVRSVFAIDGRYVADTAGVPAGADVSVIPPVSGG